MFLNKTILSFRNLVSICFISLLFTLTTLLNAQQLPPVQSPQPAEYSDGELVVFVMAAQKVMPLQQESQLKMIEEVESHDLTVDKFNDILEARSTGQNVTATEGELESFGKAIEGIEEIQAEYHGIISETIEDEGISAQKYEEIMMSYQRDPELQGRINVLLEEMQEDRE